MWIVTELGVRNEDVDIEIRKDSMLNSNFWRYCQDNNLDVNQEFIALCCEIIEWQPTAGNLDWDGNAQSLPACIFRWFVREPEDPYYTDTKGERYVVVDGQKSACEWPLMICYHRENNGIDYWITMPSFLGLKREEKIVEQWKRHIRFHFPLLFKKIQKFVVADMNMGSHGMVWEQFKKQP